MTVGRAGQSAVRGRVIFSVEALHIGCRERADTVDGVTAPGVAVRERALHIECLSAAVSPQHHLAVAHDEAHVLHRGYLVVRRRGLTPRIALGIGVVHIDAHHIFPRARAVAGIDGEDARSGEIERVLDIEQGVLAALETIGKDAVAGEGVEVDLVELRADRQRVAVEYLAAELVDMQRVILSPDVGGVGGVAPVREVAVIYTTQPAHHYRSHGAIAAAVARAVVVAVASGCSHEQSHQANDI